MSVGTVTTTTRSRRQRRARESWLDGAAEPGRRFFASSGNLLVVDGVLQAATWAGVALVAQGALQHQADSIGLGVVVMLAAGLAAVAVRRAADRAAFAGRLAVAQEIRQRLVEVLLPDNARRTTAEPAAAAYAAIELTDQVAEFHETVIPLRRQAPASMVIILLIIGIVHWPAAIVLIVSTALIPLNMKLAGIFARDGNDRHLVAIQRMGAVVLDSFRGLHTLVSLGAVDRRREEIAEASDRLNRANLDVLKRAFLSGAVMDTVVTFSMAVNATYIGLSLLHYVSIPGAPRLTLFAGLLALVLCPMYFAPMRRSAAAFHDRERAKSAAGILQGMLAAAGGEETEAPRAIDFALEAPVGVSLENVTAATGERAVFTVDRLHAEPGLWTAITGISGAGKTTLLSIIAGLRPMAGSVTWVRDDLIGTDHFAIAPVLGGCAWIGQATVIVEGTLAENIRLGREGASDDEVLHAAEVSGLRTVIDRVGLAGRIGDGGWGISTGEARRVAIARAVLSRSRLWILDEPTSHLDAATERQVLDALVAASQGSTVIVATHSRAVIDRSSTIWRIEDGRVLALAGPVAAS
ncbi:MAG TPA: ATP-binding cassette domain-containing protein [Galbitalea sp.]|nr:ATP-binding cassette domain-containing protein [Galbitalea sp.]